MQALDEEVTAITTTTIYTTATEEVTSNKTYQNFSDLLQDEQGMFRLDQDPSVFDLNNNSEDLNNDFHLINNMEFSDILSDDYISKPEEIEMLCGLDFEDYMKKEEEDDKTDKSPLPIPATTVPIIPTHTQNTPQKVVVMKQRPAVSVKMPVQQQPIKLEDNTEFDLINFITQEVSFKIENLFKTLAKIIFF